ncbi:SDR family NAD(P)-dependent oxidoreductase [Aspergillus ibericus CBS 121593]|uniref:Oxidoreductase n=1 Tax=Aspergillus ibericus CBS 121593 TaxID=1448316 RepID=A0A395GLD8_9EURO|nr:oxidoreductase [Aspergillus ibericus CBS 121593]RAK94843.1 oxidoreductase [Aspergillus ibericus CBS 121593]
MSDPPIDPDRYVRASSITEKYYRDVYPAINPSKPEFSQTGKVTIITGAGKGIGRGIARTHATAGVKALVLITKSIESGEETQALIQAEFPSLEVLALPTDITDEMAVNRTFNTIKHRFGTADTLINNAASLTSARIEESDPTKWWNNFETNVRGTYLVTAAFLRLVAADTQPTIINIISSISLTTPGLSSYLMSKLSVAKFTEFIAAENPSVRAYSLSPGMVVTGLTVEAFKPYSRDTPELTGAVTVYLAAKRPEYLNGRHLSVNWDLEELEGRKEEIALSDLLRVGQFL